MALVAFLFFWGLSFIVRGAWSVLSFVAPVLLIIAAIIDYRVIVNYVMNLWNRLLKDPLIGIVYILMTVFLFPLVAAYLVGRAWLGKKVSSFMEDQKATMGGTENRAAEDADFEIVDEDVQSDTSTPRLELPDELPQKQKSDGYTDLF